MLNPQTLRDVTQLFGRYKRNPSDAPMKIFTPVIHCYDRTYNLLQTLDFDSQSITQSSQAFQSAIENMNTLLNSSNTI